MKQKELIKHPLSQLLTGIFDPTCQEKLFGDATFREIALESIRDGNPDYVVMPAMLSMLYDTVKVIELVNQDFEGLRFYNIEKRKVRDSIVAQIKARQLCLSKVDFNDAVDPLFAIFSQLHKRKGSKEERAWYRMLAETVGYFRIACFCNRCDRKGKDSIENLLMWAHYTNYHKGICVKYHLRKENQFIDNHRRELCVLKPVIYKDKKIDVDNITLEDAFFLKSKQWAYENEHRLLYFSESPSQDYHPLNGVEIEGVYLGAKIRSSNRSYILKELKNSGIPVYQMKYNRKDVLRISPELTK